jgi:predicted TIM-barrel fold metal-dependent hydrolase
MLVGFGAGGTQNLINSYLAIYYRPFNRGTGVGSALAFGRIGGIVGPLYGGVILAAGASTAMNFCAFVVRGRPGIAGLRARPARDGCEGVMTTGEAGTSMRIVALEEHFVRPDLVARIDPDVIAARGWPLASADQPASMKRDDPLEDVGAGRLASMDRAGISVQVLSSATPGPELLPPEEAIEFARAYNDGLAATVREHPDRYAGFATLPLRAPAAAADELERAVVELGFVGTMVNGTTDGKFLDAPEFDVVLARAAALGVPVYVHPNLPVPEVFAAHYAGLPGTTGFTASMAGWGWHSETAVHVLRLVLSGALDRHPDLKIVVGHMGEGLPLMLERFDDKLTPGGGPSVPQRQPDHPRPGLDHDERDLQRPRVPGDDADLRRRPDHVLGRLPLRRQRARHAVPRRTTALPRRPARRGRRQRRRAARAREHPRWSHRFACGFERSRRVGGEEGELLGAVGTRVRVVDHEKLPGRTADGQLLAVEGELADLRMIELHGHALAGLDVVAREELAETFARERQLTDELDESWIIGVGSDGLAEARDEPGGGHIPVGVQRPFPGIEEHRPQAVLAHLQVGREGGCEVVRGKDVEIAALDECREGKRGDEFPDSGRHDLPTRLPTLPARPRCGKSHQVLGGDLVELEYPSQGLEHLEGGVAVAALLEAQVIVHADPREHRHFLTPQACHAPSPDLRQPEILRCHRLPPSTQVLTEQIMVLAQEIAHEIMVCARGPLPPGPVTPRISGSCSPVGMPRTMDSAPDGIGPEW